MAGSRAWSAAAEPRRRIGHHVEFHASIGSTNDRAWELLRAGDEGAAAVADLQTSGRGRQGRPWTSPPGVNLLVSVGIRPRLSVTDAWQLTFGAALAVREACRSTLSHGSTAAIALKWPNDVVDQGGRKLAGILIETAVSGDRISEAVIGAGMNVNWPRGEMPPELVDSTSSLLELAGAAVDRVGLLRVYLAALDAEVAGMEAGVAPLERFRAASWLTGRGVRVAVADREVDGRVVGVGEDGSLALETDAGRQHLAWGEVVQVQAASATASNAGLATA